METEKITSQERLCAEIQALAANHYEGLTNKELAALVGASESNICRDMAVFERYEFITRNEKGRLRLSPEFGGISGQIMKSYRTAKLSLTADEARYASEMQ